MRHTLTRIDLWPAVKVSFVIFTVLAFGMGLLWSMVLIGVGGMLQGAMPPGLAPMGMMKAPGYFMLLMSFVIAPVYGVVSALFVTITVLLYNFVARWTGGIAVSLLPEEGASPAEPRVVPAPGRPLSVPPDMDYDAGN